MSIALNLMEKNICENQFSTVLNYILLFLSSWEKYVTTWVANQLQKKILQLFWKNNGIQKSQTNFNGVFLPLQVDQNHLQVFPKIALLVFTIYTWNYRKLVYQFQRKIHFYFLFITSEIHKNFAKAVLRVNYCYVSQIRTKSMHNHGYHAILFSCFKVSRHKSENMLGLRSMENQSKHS